MTRPVSATATGLASADPDTTHARIASADPASFYRGFRVIPAVSGVSGFPAGDAPGSWDRPGFARSIHLSDGSSVREILTETDPPRRFAYELDRFTGFFGWLVERATSDWRFGDVDGGTAIDWRYRFAARSGRRFLVAAIVRFAWRPYMARVLARLIAEVENVP
jgi:hypothetical protein